VQAEKPYDTQTWNGVISVHDMEPGRAVVLKNGIIYSVEDTITLTLRFRILDRDLLEKRAGEAISQYGAGVLVSGDVGDMISEVLLHSNPGVESYDRYGLELI
jgi:hypothetical protein